MQNTMKAYCCQTAVFCYSICFSASDEDEKYPQIICENVMKSERPNTYLCFKEKNDEFFFVTKRLRCWKILTYANFHTKPRAKYATIVLEQRCHFAQELKDRLQSQQNMFTKASPRSDTAVKASFIVTEDIAWAAKCVSKGSFLKQYILKVC